MIQFLFENLPQMVPILVCGVFAIAIILERFRALFLVYPMRGSNAFYDKVKNLVVANRISEAIAFCDRYRAKPIARIVKEGLLRSHQPEDIIQNGLEIEASENLDRIRARTSFLSMIANVATLIGLIGTILGLVRAFESIGGAFAQSRSAFLAQGISMAMNHTLWGLAIAVPCMVFYSLMMNRTNRLRSEFERAAVRTLDLLQQRSIISTELQSQSVNYKGQRAG